MSERVTVLAKPCEHTQFSVCIHLTSCSGAFSPREVVLVHRDSAPHLDSLVGFANDSELVLSSFAR